MQKWIDDYLCVSSRPLDDAAKALIHKDIAKLRRKSVWLKLMVGFFSLLSITCLFIADKSLSDWPIGIAFYSFFPIVMGGMWIRQGKKFVKFHEQELQDGQIDLFEHPEGETLEVIDVSQRLVYSSMKEIQGSTWIPVAHCAEAPPAPSSGEFPIHLHSFYSDLPPISERALTPEELQYLKLFAARRPGPKITAIYPTIFGLGACLIAALDANELGYWLFGLILLGIATPNWIQIFRHAARSRALFRDVKEGMAVLLDPAHQNAMGYEAQESIEMLPHSRLVWREGDKPAQWRRAV